MDDFDSVEGYSLIILRNMFLDCVIIWAEILRRLVTFQKSNCISLKLLARFPQSRSDKIVSNCQKLIQKNTLALEVCLGGLVRL